MKKGLILALLGVVLAANANEVYYVNANTLNVRNTPVVGDVIDTLERGDKVVVYAKEQGWVNISDDSSVPQWISGKFLCSTENCFQVNVQTARTAVNLSQATTQNHSSSRQASPAHTYGGACPCSGSYRCTGPRGGKYCYTSSGNKSYR